MTEAEAAFNQHAREHLDGTKTRLRLALILRSFEHDLDREIAAWSEARRVNLLSRRDDTSAGAPAP